jgi:hypothetical protein
MKVVLAAGANSGGKAPRKGTGELRLGFRIGFVLG